MDKLKIRDIEILAAQQENQLVNFLCNEQCNETALKTGLLIAINAEKVILCENTPQFKRLVQQAEYKYADGIAVVFSIRKKYPKFNQLQRIAGIDLWQTLMQQCAKTQQPVFLVGAEQSVVEQVAHKWEQQNLNLVGYHSGYFDDKEATQLIEQIKQSGAKFVPVAMGSPRQEQFMQRAQQIYPDCLYMGVGGSFDVFVGKTRRAPLLWRKLNLEWLYRLLSQPTRWRRQLNILRYAYYYFSGKL